MLLGNLRPATCHTAEYKGILTTLNQAIHRPYGRGYSRDIGEFPRIQGFLEIKDTHRP